jgi:hypothetical protein
MWNVNLAILLLLTTLLASVQGIGDDGFKYPNDKKGFWINPELPANQNIPLKSGERYTFTAEIGLVKFGSKKKKDRYHHTPKQKLDIRGYYPDTNTEITEDLKLEFLKRRKAWNLEYTTPVLSGDNQNQLTITIGPTTKKSRHLLKMKAKLEKKIATINKIKKRYLGHSKKKYNIEYLDKLSAKLTAINEKIQRELERSTDTLAQFSWPLQVDNKTAAPMHYSSNFSGHKLSLDIPVGSAFEGMSSNVTMALANLTHIGKFPFPYVDDDDDHDDDDKDDDERSHDWRKWKHKDKFYHNFFFGFNDQILVTEKISFLEGGDSWINQLVLGPLSPFDVNNISLEFSRLEKDDHHKSDRHGHKSDHRHRIKHRLGALYINLPVSEDQIVPEFKEILPLDSLKYAQNFPAITGMLFDGFGRINTSTVSLQAQGTKLDSALVNMDFTSNLNLQTADDGASYTFNANINPLDEGVWKISLNGKDYAGNSASSITREMRIDRTQPVVTLDQADHQLTNNPVFPMTITVTDHSPTLVKIIQNGEIVLETEEIDFTFDANLIEGFNTFEVQTIDAAGNSAVVIQLTSIERDTIPPELSVISPADNQIVYFLAFPFSAKSNEPLSAVTINGEDKALLATKLGFSDNFSVSAEGEHSIEIKAYDLAGNLTVVEQTIKVFLKVLNRDLLTIEPHDDGLHIIGVPGAARPGVEIHISIGLFTSKSVVAADDGSFDAKVGYFTHVQLTATDNAINRTDTFELDYNANTTLSGTVKDTDGKPLPGVTVTIQSTGQTTSTNASGIFSISKPATGDQILIIDATEIEANNPHRIREFSKVHISVTLGTTQLNVIETPIYLAPLRLVSATDVDGNSSVTVTSEHALGVELSIPAGAATFPDGSKHGKINMMMISSDRTSVPPLAVAVPETVVALEPSGLQFNQPIELTLPNVNEFPPGLQVVILSKNSKKGIWEIDGVARVDDAGASIVTEEGQGITHFSEVYAAPLGMKISEYSPMDKLGVNTFDGAVSTSISLPSYKVFGQSVAPGLIYSHAGLKFKCQG